MLKFLKKFPRMLPLQQDIQNNSDRPKLTQGLASFLEIFRRNYLKWQPAPVIAGRAYGTT